MIIPCYIIALFVRVRVRPFANLNFQITRTPNPKPLGSLYDR